jgi:REP element-mobilizing transposase RayT
MSRPLRIEFPGAVYHVTSRGDRREEIYRDDTDRAQFLLVLEQACRRFDARVLSYCLMSNHYHLVLCTRGSNLSLAMRHLNGVYTQAFNRRHQLVGHLFQGRFKAILVDSDEYLMSLCRYVELNPVRARMVQAAGDWPWSSYRVHCGQASAPVWLDEGALQAFMLGREVVSEADERMAQRAYQQAVEEAVERAAMQGPADSIWATELRQQIFLGNADFVMRMQAQVDERRAKAKQVPQAQRAAPVGLAHWLQQGLSREQALRAAHERSGISMTQLAKELGVSVGWISKLIQRAEQQERGDKQCAS